MFIRLPTLRAWLLLAALGWLAGCATPPSDPPADSTAALLGGRMPTVVDIEAQLVEGNYQAVKTTAGRLLDGDPGNAKVRLLLGEALLKLNEPDGALEHFSEAANVAEFRAAALQGAGLALLRIGRLDEAVARLDEAVSSDPTLWRAYNGLGIAHDWRLEWTEAQQSYDAAIALRPESASVMNNLGMSLLLQQRFDEAVAAFEQAVRLAPEATEPETNLRIGRAMRGDYLQALAGVPRAKMADVLNNIGYVAMLQEDYDAAEAYLSRALEVSPAHHRAAARNLEELEWRREAGSVALAGG